MTSLNETIHDLASSTIVPMHKSLGFFDFPLEVRWMIYAFLIPELLPLLNSQDPTNQKVWKAFNINRFFVGTKRKKGRKLKRITNTFSGRVRICGRLMGVSQQMRFEIGPAFYNRVGFYTNTFTSPKSTRFFSSLTETTKSLLHTLTIDLDLPEVAGAKRATPERRLASAEPLANLISTLPNLRYLKIGFNGISYHPSTSRVSTEINVTQHPDFWRWGNFARNSHRVPCPATLSDFDHETLQLLKKVAAACPHLHAHYNPKQPLFKNEIVFIISTSVIEDFHEEDWVNFDPVAGYAARDTKHAQLANLREFFWRKNFYHGVIELRNSRSCLVNSNDRYLATLLHRVLRGENYNDWVFWKTKDGEVKIETDLADSEKQRFESLGKGTTYVSTHFAHSLISAKSRYIRSHSYRR